MLELMLHCATENPIDFYPNMPRAACKAAPVKSDYPIEKHKLIRKRRATFISLSQKPRLEFRRFRRSVRMVQRSKKHRSVSLQIFPSGQMRKLRLQVLARPKRRGKTGHAARIAVKR
jgi:hypothetical protein